MIHLLEYLKKNQNRGLKYYNDVKDSPIYEILAQYGIDPVHALFGTHDASWQDCQDTARSTGSYIHFAQGSPVDFSSYVPSPIAMSSAEAETNAGATASMAMGYLRMTWNDLQNSLSDELWVPPILMLCDNKSAVTIVNTDKDYKSQRHAKRRTFYMRQCLKEKEIKYEFASNEIMWADIGTKNLDVPTIQPLVNVLTVEVPP